MQWCDAVVLLHGVMHGVVHGVMHGVMQWCYDAVVH